MIFDKRIWTSAAFATGKVLILSFLLAGASEWYDPAMVVHGQTQVTDNKSTNHIFAQIADGRFSDGNVFRSTIVISSDASTATSCTATLSGLTIPGFGNGQSLSVNVPAGRVAVVETPGTQSGVYSGYLSLTCGAAVAAQLLYSFRSASGAVLGEATVFSSPAATVAQLFVDQRNGAQLGIAIANPGSTSKEIVIVASDQAGTQVGTSSVQLAPGGQTAKFLSDLVKVPANFTGPVQIFSNSTSTSDIYAIGLRFNGEVFTTIPSVLRTTGSGPVPTGPTVSAVPAAGVLDTSFNTAGKIVTTFGAYWDIANAVAIQTDGKIVVAGTTTWDNSFGGDFAVARYNTNGTLDTTFDTDGKVATFIAGASSSDIATAVAIQTDGKILAAGTADNSFAVVRYNTNGSLDLTFGTGGKVTTSIVNEVLIVNAAVIQTDGKIVVAGSALARYNTNGSLDTTFGTGGIVTRPYQTNVFYAVGIQTDGKIVAAGQGAHALVRYNSNGSVDTTFGIDGMVTSNGVGIVTAMLIQTDGRIVAAGGIGGPFALFRFNTDGSLETIFERTTGPDYSGPNYVIRGLALQTDGKLVTAGYDGVAVSGRDFVVRRHNADGSIDATFGTGGVVVTPTFWVVNPQNGPNPRSWREGGRALAIQTDGKIVVAGSETNGANMDFVVIRYR